MTTYFDPRYTSLIWFFYYNHKNVHVFFSFTAEPRWFEVIGTASNTSKYWGFELTNYEHPYLPTEKYVEL